MAQTDDIRAAYKSAVEGYQPWHNHGNWNSSGRDSFWQIIEGGIKHGIFDIKEASEMFGVPPATAQKWAEGRELPVRKSRIKAWKAIKNILQ